jgi:type I restriction enzyme S subunit
MLLSNLNLLATAPGGVARLRELILTLAVQGKLVPQDPSDESARDLLQRVAANAIVRSAKSHKASGGSDEIAAPYGLPDGWAWSRLGDIVENMGSGWSPACDEGERTDPTRWAVLRTTAVQVNEYRAREHKVIPSKLSPRPEIEVKDGDILITRAGPMNRVGISCWVNNTPPRLMLSDKIVRFHSIADEMLPAFVVLALNAGWTKSLIEQAKTGMAASQVNISQTDLRGFWLPVCSKAEQSRIVTRVEELMHLCDALEAKGRLEATQHAQLVSTLLATLTESETPAQLTDNWHRIATHFDLLLDRPEAVDALEQTILQLAVRGLLVPQDPEDEPASVLLKNIRAEKDKLIAEGKIKRDKPLPPIAEDEQPFALPQGWEWVTMDGLASQITDGAHHTPTYIAEGVPFLSVKDLSSGFIDFSDTRFISPQSHEDLAKRCNPEMGDVLLTKIGTTGIAVVVDTPRAFSLFVSVALIKLPSVSVDRDFLSLVINSPFVRQQSEDGTEGVGNKNLVLRKIKAFQIPIPPLAEQSRIVTRVAQLRRLCVDLRQRLSASQSTQAHLAEALVQEVA